jgi:hypothetical protein
MVWNQQEEIVNSLGKGSGRGSRLFTKPEKTGDSFNIDGGCLYLACGAALRRRYSLRPSCLFVGAGLLFGIDHSFETAASTTHVIGNSIAVRVLAQLERTVDQQKLDAYVNRGHALPNLRPIRD